MIAIIAILVTSGVLMKISSQTGRYCYWKTHRVELEEIAHDILECYPTAGMHIMPPERISQLEYPVFIYVAPTNAFSLVGFVHWSTTPKRLGGFIYAPHGNDETAGFLDKKTKQHKRIGDKWYEYKEWMLDSSE
jgi:hypothetical protein